ncbi:hypothetical protein B1772_03490 [Dehalococcoides mccartyi]|nr:hypothetical protein B1776_03180 [Dehalococcoides mccartyi]AQY73146.1 hypothetical protein B1772_03490 [Dehalococcoides mccartyi]
MNILSARFSDDMRKTEEFVDLIKSTFDLAKQDIKHLRSKHPIMVNALDVHTKARKLGGTSEVYDGAFLTICAQYEFTVRDLIETFAGNLSSKIPIFQNLPDIIRSYYPKGCATLLLHIDQEKYNHLTQQDVLSSLASCVNCSTGSPYHFVVDAFSNHERNLNAGVINEIYSQRLGMKDIWKRIARQTALADYLGSKDKNTVEKIAKEKLDGAIKHRNNIIHRGRSFSHTGESEVRNTAQYFSALMDSLAIVMDKYEQSLDAGMSNQSR